jgi:pSer/pThr/pTyr-binding forkhead associated (FHA) protein
MKVTLTFALYQGDQLVRRESVTQDIVKVGKDPKSHLRVDDDLASRMHAVIEVASVDDITLIDLGNEPGTVVNGARVNKCKVHPGDQIQVGGTLIVLEGAQDAAAAQPGVVPPPPGAAPIPLRMRLLRRRLPRPIRLRVRVRIPSPSRLPTPSPLRLTPSGQAKRKRREKAASSTC